MAQILLVDDAHDIRLLVRAVLQHAGHDVVEAESGVAALALLALPPPPDAVILDIQMPGLDGWQTLTQLRETPAVAEIPVLMCSVKASPEDHERAWSLGCDGYLTKPFNIADLVHTIDAVIARTAAERLAVRRKHQAAASHQSSTTAP